MGPTTFTVAWVLILRPLNGSFYLYGCMGPPGCAVTLSLYLDFNIDYRRLRVLSRLVRGRVNLAQYLDDFIGPTTWTAPSGLQRGWIRRTC
jgi:hypothetical protein